MKSKQRPILRSLAPAGYRAVVAIDGCTGCSFESSFQCGMDRRCCECERRDRRNVIFVSRRRTVSR